LNRRKEVRSRKKERVERERKEKEKKLIQEDDDV